ncbi:MAG: 5'/3'-nucleotidase SurE [Chloroflexi bacterium]|nr:5'/3'-nucleotidase SurE [Chloroflexota bacterium]
MRILVTNDDGVYAPGMWTLVEALAPLGEIVVVAPDREQSGVGTSVTLHHPVRASAVSPQIPGIETYAVEGTPSDSIILALRTLAGHVDMVYSGINEGANLGNDALISGTVGAALQGYFHGLPSIALSVGSLEVSDFTVAARLGLLLGDMIRTDLLPRQVLLNVNVPNKPLEEIEGLEVTRLGRRSYVDIIDEGHDGKRKYYWIVRGKPTWDVVPGTDIWAMRNGRASITPLCDDLTSQDQLSLLEEQRGSLMDGLRQAAIERSVRN